MADLIISLMPPHTHYVEPYFGGGQVLFRKNPEGVSEAVNDINGGLMNFWRVLQDEELFAVLRKQLDVTPFSEDMFNGSSSKFPFDCEVKAEPRSAVEFFIRYRQSRQGLGKSFATLSRNRTRRGMNEQVSSWLSAIEGLPEAHERLKRVVILNRDALGVIRQQDGENTLHYLDPPYVREVRISKSAYKHEMASLQHARLLIALSKIKGKFILSGYPSSLYSLAEKKYGWHRIDVNIDNKASSKKVKDVKTECLWMNYMPKEPE